MDTECNQLSLEGMYHMSGVAKSDFEVAYETFYKVLQITSL